MLPALLHAWPLLTRSSHRIARRPVSAVDHSVDFAPHAAAAAPVPLSAIAQLAASMHAGDKLDALYVASKLPSLSMADIEASLAALAAQGVLTHLAREDRFVRSGPDAAAPTTAAPTRRGTGTMRLPSNIARS